MLRGDADANIRFHDLRALLSHLGFDERIRGGHHIFSRTGIAEILNLQARESKAKAYQVKQVRGVLTTYGLVGQSRAPASEAGETSAEQTGPEATEQENGR